MYAISYSCNLFVDSFLRPTQPSSELEVFCEKREVIPLSSYHPEYSFFAHTDRLITTPATSHQKQREPLMSERDLTSTKQASASSHGFSVHYHEASRVSKHALSNKRMRPRVDNASRSESKITLSKTHELSVCNSNGLISRRKRCPSHTVLSLSIRALRVI